MIERSVGSGDARGVPSSPESSTLESGTLKRSTQGADDPKIRVLVVDDEESITQLIAMTLRHEGFDVATAATGAEALEKLHSFEPDIAVLDIMLPDFDGMRVLSRIRAEGNLLPVLFLTALDSIDDRVSGLTAGGDDYMVKPFSLEELIARLRAIYRRAQTLLGQIADPVLRLGDLRLNEDSYEVWRGSDPIELTTTEFELLRYLIRNPQRVLSKAQILDRVWSYDFAGKHTVVELYISYLRKKIDQGRSPMIHTVRGAGYMIRAAE